MRSLEQIGFLHLVSDCPTAFGLPAEVLDCSRRQGVRPLAARTRFRAFFGCYMLASGQQRMRTTITARRLLREKGIVEYPEVAVEDGHIHLRAIAHERGGARDSYPEALLVPAYVNIHVHGAVGHDVMEGTPKALQAIGAALAGHGVGAYYPTTVTSSTEETLRALDMIARVIEQGTAAEGAAPLGIHLEGPFLSAAASAGSIRLLCWCSPSIALFDRFWQAAQGTHPDHDHSS